jgi:hypothetical protein
VASPRLTRALIDNSAFAGVMRCYRPDVDVHSKFLRNYPEHREIDEASLGDFLTALCIYQELLIESSSGWNDADLRTRHVSGEGWVDSLKKLLPKEVSILIKNTYFSDALTTEGEAMEKAYDIMTSPLKENILADPGPKLPAVYYAKDYIYREPFEQLNQENGSKLTRDDLVLAMFLHRGLLLQSIAHGDNCVYLPYQFRGKLLSKLPPMTWARGTFKDFATRLPLSQGSRPSETDTIRTLNEFYYSLLQAVTWTTYSSEVPFIGSAILAAARGDAAEAIKIAMDYRRKGGLRTALGELDRAIKQVDRPKFDSLLAQYRSELTAAAQHFGLQVDSPKHKTFYELAICWMPKEIKAAVKAAASILPPSLQRWAYKASSTLITKSPLQMLFVQHVSDIRAREV